MNKRVRVGVIGASPVRGWFLTAHLPALRALSHRIDIHAVCTSRLETAQTSAAAVGAPLAFVNPHELIECEAVDLVVVTVKTAMHQDIVAAAIRAGKDVFCEWPLGHDVGEAEALATQAEAAGVRHLIGLQGRAAPVINQIRDLIRNGYIGRILSTSIVASGFGWGAAIDPDQVYLFDDASGSSMLMIQGGHLFDTLGYVCGEFRELGAQLATLRRRTAVLPAADVMRLRSFAATLAPESAPASGAPSTGVLRATQWFTPTSPDQVIVNGTLESGALACVHIRGGQCRGTNLLWEINGEDGDLQITGAAGTIQIVELKLKGGRGRAARLHRLPLPKPHRPPLEPAPRGPASNIWHLYKTYLGEDTAAKVELADFHAAVHRQRMLEVIKTAAKSGNTQRVPNR